MPPYPARNIRLSAIVPSMNDQPKIWTSTNPLAIAGMMTRMRATSAQAGWMRWSHSPVAAPAALLVELSAKAMAQRLASRPCGRTASTSTMIRNVRTIA